MRIFIEGDDYVPTRAIRQDKFERSREVTDFLVVYFLKTNGLCEELGHKRGINKSLLRCPYAKNYLSKKLILFVLFIFIEGPLT